MIELSQLNEIQLIVFGLIMLRMIAFVTSAAVLSSPSVPITAKVLLSMVLTMMVYTAVADNQLVARVSDQQNSLIMLAALELIVGLCLGFLTRMFFFAVSMAGEMISIALGLGQAQIFNPLMGSQGNAMEQFLVMFASLVFLAINGHHLMIQGLIQSFSTIPVANVNISAIELSRVVLGLQDILVIAVRMAAPIVISMLVIQIGIGLLSRAVPQINVLSTAASVSALIGIILLIICLPLMSNQMSGAIEETSASFFSFVKGI
ncbi:MAG: flagellar biosynthetic protein FliR [Moraxellaceae bacterium]|nr:flagellar biosynthetic protein FliR [Pseudobdellovibrionaceae bacterium]